MNLKKLLILFFIVTSVSAQSLIPNDGTSKYNWQIGKTSNGYVRIFADTTNRDLFNLPTAKLIRKYGVLQDTLDLGIDTTFTHAAILALTDSVNHINSVLLIHENTFASFETQLTQDALNIGLLSTSVYGGIVWDREESLWEDYTTKWDSLFPGLRSTMLDSLEVHRSGINVNSDSVYIFSSRTRSGDSIVSYINVSPSSVKISAPHITFDGASIFKAINGNNYDSTSIKGDVITSGIIKSNNWSVIKGSYINLDLGTILLGGAATQDFYVDSTGYAKMKKGKIAATFFDSTKIYIGTGDFANANTALYLGTSGLSLTNQFSVTSNGVLTASNVNVTGLIKMESGWIGDSTGWAITTNTIADADYNVGLSSTVTVGDDLRIWAGSTSPSTAEFQLYESGLLKTTSALIGTWNVNATSIYTGTEDHSGYTANAGDVTLYSTGNDASFHANKFYIDNTGTLYANGVSILDGSIGLGATSYTIGHGVWLSSTAGSMFRVGNVNAARTQWTGTNLEIYNSSNTKVASFGASNTISGLEISNLSITGNLTMGAAGKIWINNAGEGANGYVIDINGVRGYSAVLGNTFNLPTDGSAPTFSSGIINYTIFNVNTNSVIRTSETVGDGSASSAGVLINNTGLYATGANQLLANANVKIIAATGAISAKLGTIGSYSINSTSIYTGTEDHSGYTTNAGDLTIYSDGSDASIHAKNFYIDAAGSITATSATLSGAITAGAGSSISGVYIDSLNASKITAGVLSGSFYTVGTAGVSGYIKSYDYVTNTTGWKIGKALAEFNGATITGGTIQTAGTNKRIVLDGANNRIQIYDSGNIDCGYIQGVGGNLDVQATLVATTLGASTYRAGSSSGGSYTIIDISRNILHANTIGVASDDKFYVNASGQITKINNTVTSGYIPISNGTHYEPRALTTADLPLSSDYAWTGTHTLTKAVSGSYYLTLTNSETSNTSALSGVYIKSNQGGSAAGTALQAFSSQHSDATLAGYGRVFTDASLNGLVLGVGTSDIISFRVNNTEKAQINTNGIDAVAYYDNGNLKYLSSGWGAKSGSIGTTSTGTVLYTRTKTINGVTVNVVTTD